MADSVASIRSIYSGKGEFSDGDYEALSGMSLVAFGPGESQNGANIPPSSSSDFHKFQDNFAALNQGQGSVPGITDPVSHHYSEQKQGDLSNAQNGPIILANKGSSDWYDNNISSTNVSVSSSYSENHLGVKASVEYAYPDFEYGPGESYSRPLSRNSTTSGFSTTATKDGVEGKRPYRTLPKSLLDNILAGKTQKTAVAFQNNLLPEQSNQFQHNLPSLGSNAPDSYTTLSPEKERGPKLLVPALPPITIDEKIKLMDQEEIQ